MLPYASTKFRLNPTYRSGADIEDTTEDFQDGHNGGHLGYRNKIILSNLPFGSRYGLKIFKMATMGAFLNDGAELFW